RGDPAGCVDWSSRRRQFLLGKADQPGSACFLCQRHDGPIAMNELLDQFVLEARDLIQEGSEDLVALERAPDDPERLERIFRAFHTLKGGAAIVDLPVMVGLLHAGEDVLASLRAREISVSPTVIDTALR